MIHYKAIIAQNGGDPDCYFTFDPLADADQLHLLPYATLTAARRNHDSVLQSVVGVYEWQNAPLFMLVNGDVLGSNPDNFKRVRRLVALRGDAPYLAILNGGRVTFHDVGLDNHNQPETEALNPTDGGLAFAIPHIASSRPSKVAKERWISDVILKLLSDALDDLTKIGIESGDAISIVGRALFARFLADRHLLVGQDLGEPETFFDTHTSAVKVSAWLDKTFNGDFLPLTADRIAALPEAALISVGNILRRAPGGQLSLEWSENWASLDFAHIPVGVLSQAYEQYLGAHDPDKQHSEGSYYTPRHIAELMVQASFAALQRDGLAHQATILDPAAGAGVFLITAFRQLVKERWRHDQKRPDTATLREILYNQVTGFDINEAALRFAALGLYLMSIELDGEPMPVSKLKFETDLIGSVIFEFGKADKKSLGSLGDEVGPEHLGKYDLVIGNPPWSKKGNQLSHWPSLQKRVADIAETRSAENKGVKLLPKDPRDLPFIWRSMEWAKPGAQIAFALHGRLLFQRRDGMDKAFAAICRSVNVTGVVNGTEVRQSNVWPNVSAPFCLLFAQNVKPRPNSGFRFVSPHLEGPLNETGGWRLDPAQTESLRCEDVAARPELLKILFRGSRLDLEVFERLSANKFPTFGQYWADLHGGTTGQPKCAGKGFQFVHRATKPKAHEGDLPGYSAEPLFDLPLLDHTCFDQLLLETGNFRLFRDLNVSRLDERRNLDLYRGPMLLIKKSPAADGIRFRSAVSLTDLAFSQTYYGYTAHKRENADQLVKYMCLVVSSKAALWNALITSGGFGVERDVVEKYVVQEVPMRPFEQLSDAKRKEALSLFDALAERETPERWKAVDDWVGLLFGLSADDVQVISDTLDYALPFGASKKAAQGPAKHLIGGYCERLQAELHPWSKRFGRQLSVKHLIARPLSPWEFVVISANGGPRTGHEIEAALKGAMTHTTDALSSSEIIYRDEANDCLYHGRLNQARYWSISQARLAARRIIWEHVDFLSGRKTA